ncbi:unnamed protein product [Caenorhabditis sp. 36 PRJEB53466]|nr:unnamed protein product [Caenorhabditis sp. 36 PRJEB53466]
MASRLRDGLLYPPPPKHKGSILAVVVEKKGDETQTSMRQSEIYAYSHEIIIRDGYMVMPKIVWKDYEPGEWFICDRVFSTDRHGQEKEERELINLHKIAPSAYKNMQIPPTRFEHGNVKIVRPFVLCPLFIRNRETRNSYGSYKKVYLLNLGQGFFSDRTALFKSLCSNRVYNGVFEFRAKDNGAVNFGYRSSELKDNTGHVLERDSMWELDHPQMVNDLNDLQEYAQKFNENLERQKAFEAKRRTAVQVPKHNIVKTQLVPVAKLEPPSSPNRSMPLPVPREPRKTGCARVDELQHQLHQLRVGMLQKPTMTPRELNNWLDPELANRHIAPPQPNRNLQVPGSSDTTMTHDETPVSQAVFQNEPMFRVPVITNREQLEAHRSRTIQQSLFDDPDAGRPVLKWIDRETGEKSTDSDILNYKFDVRYNVGEDPRLAIPDPVPASHNHTLSDLSFLQRSTVIEPLASSTPRTSPEPQRRRNQNERRSEAPPALLTIGRNVFPSQPRNEPPSALRNERVAQLRNETPQRRPIESLMQPHSPQQHHDGNETDATVTLCELQRDNNANPTGPRRRIANLQR